MKKLINVLRKVGKPTKVYTTPDGTRVLVLPYGGRVLGLFPAKSDENFYWTHTALESVKTAREFYAGDASMQYRAQRMLSHVPVGRPGTTAEIATTASSLPRRRIATSLVKSCAWTTAGPQADSFGTFDQDP